MPDYNPKATAYWWTMVALGSAAFVYSLLAVRALPFEVIAQIFAGGALAAIAGFFPVRIPGSKNSFVAGEIFIFLLLLLHGAPAATIAAAAEAYVGAHRSSKRWTSRIASPAMSALAIFLAGQLLMTLYGWMGAALVGDAGWLLLAAMSAALVYFVANTLFVSLVFTLKRNEPFNVGDFVSSFGTIGVAYGGSALVAALLYLIVQSSGNGKESTR